MTVPVTLAFLGASPGELFIIFIVVLILFGPKKLPETARWIGEAMEDLRRTSQEFHSQILKLDQDIKEEPPKPAPREIPPMAPAEGASPGTSRTEEDAAHLETPAEAGGILDSKAGEKKNDLAG